MDKTFTFLAPNLISEKSLIELKHQKGAREKTLED